MRSEEYLGAQIPGPLLAAIVIGVLLVAAVILWRKREVSRVAASSPAGTDEAARQPAPPLKRESDALYQREHLVARVLDAEVNEAAKRVHFGEIYNSDRLLIPEACEYQKFVIQIQAIEYASRADRESMQKGRILRGVRADIVGYRQP